MEEVGPHDFALLSGQRSGSTLLIRSLDLSPDIFCAGELFHYRSGVYHSEYQFKYIPFPHPKMTAFANKYLSRNSVKKHLENFYRDAGKGVKACGFKLMKSQIDWNPSVLDYLIERKVQLFVLVRQSDFETALSSSKAIATGAYHSDEKLEHKEIEIKLHDFERALERAKANREQLLKWAKLYNAHILLYEQMLANWDDFIFSLGNKLNIKELKVEMALQKMGGSKGEVIVRNLSDLKAKFG
jgi:LPS sulfotransferase NodH